MPDAQHLPRGAGESATHLRRSDRSGLIDIRALSSVIDAQRRAEPTASASSLALPSFGSAWALHGVSAPSVAVTASPVVPATRPAEDNRPLYAMIAVLSVAVLSLGIFVALRGSTTMAAAAPLPPEAIAPVVVADDVDAADTLAEREPEPEPEPEPSVAGAEGSLEADAAPKLAAEASAKPRTKRRRAKNRPRTRQPKADAGTATRDADSSDAVPFKCVVNPEACGATKRGPEVGSTAETQPKGPLPKSPSSAQIRAALAKVKPAAKACAGSHGGKAGDRVRVKFSIEGSSGRVKSITPLGEHKGSGLGRCVADALSHASFPRFSKPQFGLEYALRL